MRSVEQADNGEWCVVEDGRWFPFGDRHTSETSAKMERSRSLYDTDYQFYADGKSSRKATSKYTEEKEAKKLLEANDPKPAGPGSLGYMTTKYYDKSFIENLKANTGKSITFYNYAPIPSKYAATIEPTPEPPKKAMPKAVPEINGRKFRDEE